MQVNLDDNQRFETANADAVTRLAKEIDHPLPIVQRVYEAEFTRLRADAKVTSYLVVLASRSAREVLRRRSA
jgi:hypothetical protein